MRDKKKWVILIQISLILIAAIATTYAVATFNNEIDVAISTANLDLQYEGESTLSGSLIPLYDEEAPYKSSKVRFSVVSKTDLPNTYVGYRVVLNNINIPSALKNAAVKWQLVKGVSVIASGSFDDINVADRYILNEELEILPKYGTTPDDLEFRVWISESGEDQSSLSGYTASMKVDVELYTINDKNTPIFYGIQDKILPISTGSFDTNQNVSIYYVDGSIAPVTVSTGAVDLTKEGDTLVTYMAKKKDGTSITKTRVIRVVNDTVTPTINMDNIPSSFMQEEDFTFPSEVAFGPMGGQTICNYNDSTRLAVGSYTLKCTAYGNNGLKTTLSKDFTVTALDSTKPKIYIGFPVTIDVGNAYILPSKVTYATTGSITCKDEKNNTLTDTSSLSVGSHTITCTAIDDNGKTSTRTHKVNVIDAYSYYNEGTKAYTITKAGTYKIEAYGASSEGICGSYVAGEKRFSVNDILNLTIGSDGVSTISYNATNILVAASGNTGTNKNTINNANIVNYARCGRAYIKVTYIGS